MVEIDRANLIGEIIRLQQKTGHAIGQQESEVWMGLDLTICQLKSLFFINFEENTKLRKLATALGVTPPNVTGIVDRLSEQGLVVREDNPEDRRMILLKTTDKGKTLLANLRDSKISRLSVILAQMNAEELSVLARGLTALDRATERIKEKHKDEYNKG